jgi:hypothetical protein
MPEEKPLQSLVFLKLVCESEFVVLVEFEQVEELS